MILVESYQEVDGSCKTRASTVGNVLPQTLPTESKMAASVDAMKICFTNGQWNFLTALLAWKMKLYIPIYVSAVLFAVFC